MECRLDYCSPNNPITRVIVLQCFTMCHWVYGLKSALHPISESLMGKRQYWSFLSARYFVTNGGEDWSGGVAAYLGFFLVF
ncbi:hypothetical protein TNCV_2317901 [Trichonephila clavipes]|nr:hypothetical protein TNCV_762361 [Trichonephila clavipes]GFW28642.1 hypothetical protein TNCV_2317901 [Trichonephila clavipes]